MRRVFFACFVLMLFALPARAADEVKIKEAFWQRVAGAGWVDFDPDYNPVFHLEGGYYFAKTGTFVKYKEGGPQVPAYFDRAGRVWVKDNKEVAVRLWDGSKWEKFPYAPRHLFDDSTGRVFLFDGTHVRVFDKDGKWTEQEISKTKRAGKVGFAEQNGRVWMWVWAHGRENERDLGAWSLTDGKWKHHTLANGFHFHSVHCVYPMADGRVLLLEYQPPGYGRSPPYYWHPDKKLAPDEMRALDGKVAGSPHELAYGTDGTLYFGANASTNSVWMAFDAKGKPHELPNRNLFLAGIPNAIINGRRVVFGKLGDAPPVMPSGAGEFLGADRDGRLYFRPSFTGWKGYENRVPVTAVWPKFEKPGEVLRVEKEKLLVTGVAKDDVGKLWAEPVGACALLQWHNGKWIDTPVQSLFYPSWTGRAMSPWSHWTWRANRIFRLHGANGSVFVVRIRDMYQLDDPPRDGDRFPPRVINDPKFPHPAPHPPLPAGAERPKYWLEAWLFRDGKWSGPTEIRKLLATESASLLKDFPTASGEMSFFSLVNDGTRLWAAFDGKVLCADKTGIVTEADWPCAKPKDPLPHLMLSRTAAGKVVLSAAVGDGHSLSLKEGMIASADFMMPGNNPAANTNETTARWKLAKDGTLWYWVATTRGGLACAMWHYRDGKWIEKKGVGIPVHEDANGDTWCVPEPRATGKLLVVNGTATKEFVFPDEPALGFQTIPKGAAVWALEDRLYCLEPGAKPVLRWRLLSEKAWGIAPAVTDDKGTVLFDNLRGTLK